ncbi:hypothetical protein [Microbacterium sp. GCS4]|uniref:hypothetical protein n=1 Tax=Microbacterium sp. GCS4 TaxID=1692239 RepID=UPI0006803F89|nr:hypothetical protein [Microbacterium sp. GCS4]KNY04838.1 hypothetical protein AKH00_15350 [Microbacterium sp. GCS4]
MSAPLSTAPRTDAVAAAPRRTDRLILWAAVLATVVVMVVRLSGQLLERITADDQVRDLAAGLDDPALAELAVRMGVMLAVVISAVFQIIYLFLCATVDEKLLAGVMVPTGRRADRKGRRPALGPAVMVGIAATLPVQLTALAFGLTAPKDSPFLVVWLVVLVAVVSVWACTRPALRDRGLRGRILLVAVLVVVAAISFLL